MAESPVVLNKSGRIAYLTLNSPPRNEMNQRFFDAFSTLVTGKLPRLNVDGIIVHGRGRHFSSGANIDELKDGLAGRKEGWDKDALLETTLNFSALRTLPFPVVAAVKGCCFGSALELAMACHYRLAVPNAVFALPEIAFDLMPGCGGTIMLRELVGYGKAAEMILSGQSMAAGQAQKIGLIDLVVDKADLLEKARSLIQRLNRTRGSRA